MNWIKTRRVTYVKNRADQSKGEFTEEVDHEYYFWLNLDQMVFFYIHDDKIGIGFAGLQEDSIYDTKRHPDLKRQLEGIKVAT